MDAALESLEPDPSGFIRESFLEAEIETGLTQIAQITESLTDEANSIMDQVADIIGLPHLDDSDVHEGVQRAKVKRNNTVTDLHEFDATQTAALSPIETDLATMESWLANIESLFTDGTTTIEFKEDHWTTLSAENTLTTDLAYRTAEMMGVGNRSDIDGMPGTHLGTDSTSEHAGIHPTEYGNETTALSGVSNYSLPGMATQSVPLHDANLRGTSLSGSSAILKAGGRSLPSKVTSTTTTGMEKPKQKKKKKKPNKLFGFMKSAADFLILDDVKTVVNPNASFFDKGLAIISVTPAGKALKAGRLGVKFVKKSPAAKRFNPKKVDKSIQSEGKRPPNLTPEGAGRVGAFKEAKRNSGIPVSQNPDKVTASVDRRGNRIPGRDYDFGNGKVIRDHSGGHKFPDDPTQNRGPHFNDVKGEHYDYFIK